MNSTGKALIITLATAVGVAGFATVTYKGLTPVVYGSVGTLVVIVLYCLVEIFRSQRFIQTRLKDLGHEISCIGENGRLSENVVKKASPEIEEWVEPIKAGLGNLENIFHDLSLEKKDSDILRQIAEEVFKAREFPALCNGMITRLVSHLGYETGGIFLVDPTGKSNQPVASVALPDDLKDLSLINGVGSSISETVLNERHPLIIENYQSLPDAGGNSTQSGIKSIAVFPIHGDGRLIGYLLTASKKWPVVSLSERNTLEKVASLAGVIMPFWFQVVDRKEEERQRYLDLIGSINNQLEQMTNVLAAMPVPTWLKDVDGRFLFSNQAFLREKGSQIETIHNRSATEIRPEENLETGLAKEKALFETKKSIQSEELWTNPKGGQKWYEVTRIPLFSSSGQVSQTVGFAVDITPYKNIQSSLKKSNQHLENLVQDRSLQLAQTNQAFSEEIEGRRKLENRSHRRDRFIKGLTACLEDKSGDEYFHDLVNQMLGLLGNDLEADGVVMVEMEMQDGVTNRVDTRHVWIWPQQPPSGSNFEKVLCAGDWNPEISAKLDAGEIVTLSQSELNQTEHPWLVSAGIWQVLIIPTDRSKSPGLRLAIYSRTADNKWGDSEKLYSRLAVDTLWHNLKLIDMNTVNKSILYDQKMSSTVLEEWHRSQRDSLQLLAGLIVSIKDTNWEDSAGNIRRQTCALLEKNVLLEDFANAGLGNRDKEKTEIDPVQIIEICLEQHVDTVIHNGLQTGYEVGAGIPHQIRIDGHRLLEAMTLATHWMVTHSHKGTIKIRWSWPEDNQGRDKILIRIGSNCVDKKFKSSLNALSERGRKEKTVKEGTTMPGWFDLEAARRLVTLLKGSIRFEFASQEQDETTLLFEIPMAVECATDHLEKDVHTPQSLEGRKYLIIDDNPTNRVVLSRYLKTWGSVSLAVETAAQAVEALRGPEVFDGALIDMDLPEMKEIGFINEIRQQSRTRDLPLVLFGFQKENGASMSSLGLTVNLEKPAQRLQLHTALIDLQEQRNRYVYSVFPYIYPTPEKALWDQKRFLLLGKKDYCSMFINQSVSRAGAWVDQFDTLNDYTSSHHTIPPDFIVNSGAFEEDQTQEIISIVQKQSNSNNPPRVIHLVDGFSQKSTRSESIDPAAIQLFFPFYQKEIRAIININPEKA